jgi:carotenoid 1,2-hydratase
VSLQPSILEDGPSAYRWYYLDLHAPPFTAVFIFMIGAVFSPRYSIAARKGALPRSHCAVNFALYEEGARWLWVLSEYDTAHASEGRLEIGRSRLEHLPGGRVRATVVDETAPWGRPAEASLELEPACDGVGELRLVEGQRHFWWPVAVRARGTLRLPARGLRLEGDGYHDANRGDEPLGGALPGWRWTRVHGPRATQVHYHCEGERTALSLLATRRGAVVRRVPAAPEPTRYTAWGLKVPEALTAGSLRLTKPRLLESSPFYARSEAHARRHHALGEVADFRRFHAPYFRWMAHFRTRVGARP